MKPDMQAQVARAMEAVHDAMLDTIRGANDPTAGYAVLGLHSLRALLDDVAPEVEFDLPDDEEGPEES